jgi:hypothetical protein
MIKLKDLIPEVLHKPVPRFLYHATFNGWIPNIEREGILPSGEIAHGNFSNIESGVYLAENPNEAGSFVEVSENPNIPEEWFNEIVVIKIDTSKLDLTKFDVDPNVIPHEGDVNIPFIYKGTVHPSAFVEITDYV